MKPAEVKHSFIELRAEGLSYDKISKKLKISKGTCYSWNKELEEEIAELKKEQLKALYKAYGMEKEARIKRLGNTLEQIEAAVQQIDFLEIPPERLLDYKLKYTEALNKEYTSLDKGIDLDKELEGEDIIRALGNLVNRVKSGEVNAEQANRESRVLTDLLKAYETTEVKAQLEEIKAVIESR